MNEHLEQSIAALIAQGEREGCINLTRFNEFVKADRFSAAMKKANGAAVSMNR